MRGLLLIVILFTVGVHAQNGLNFNKRFVESEDKWVAFKPDGDGNYNFGFIYIDEMAGLTLHYGGTFKISPNGEFVPKKEGQNSFTKVRLKPNNVLVAFIPENKFKDLKFQAVPEWLKFYKTDLNSVERLYRWGFLYNGWGECEKALTYLKKAEKKDPDYKGLAVELSFSYNCLGHYEKSEGILKKELKSNSTDPYVNKEYIYTLTRQKKIDKAIKHFKKSLETVSSKKYNLENCFNIMGYYYLQKDKKNFDKWYKELLSLADKDKMQSQYIRYAKTMKTDLAEQ